MNRFFPLVFYFFSMFYVNAKNPPDTLIVGYTPAAPFIITGENDPSGISVWLWEEIAGDLELNYRLEEIDFSALLEKLENGEIDVSINPLTITADRCRKMDFTLPFFASHSTVVRSSSSWQHRFLHIIGAIFNLNFIRVVAGLFLLIGAIGLIVWFFEKRKNPQQFRPGIKGVWDGLWWSAVTMTTVGYGDKSPKSRIGKLIALVWMFSGIIFISGFTASIASSLTVSSIHESADKIEDFKDREVGCIAATSTYEFLKANFFKNVKTYPNLVEGLNALIDQELDAFLYDEPILKYRMNQDSKYKNIELLPIKFNLQFYAFAFSEKNRALEKEISKKIIEKTESLEWKMLLTEFNLEHY